MPLVPVIEEAVELVKQNVFTGASTRNWAGYSNEVSLEDQIQSWQQNLLTDPQTSGGLLVSCDPSAEKEVMSVFERCGFDSAKKIGTFEVGKGLRVQS